MKIVHTKSLHIKMEELAEKLGFDQEKLRLIEIVPPKKNSGQEAFLRIVLNEGKEEV